MQFENKPVEQVTTGDEFFLGNTPYTVVEPAMQDKQFPKTTYVRFIETDVLTNADAILHRQTLVMETGTTMGILVPLIIHELV